ncbi:MAG: methylenetetrahydrofolate reductase [Planctomycetota bacterium]|nr:methylenetetrahydrofolate reductase [Planctomycetota bacterium]
MSQLEERLKSGQFTVTGEIGPPKGTNVAPCLHEAEEFLKGRVVAVNVTDIQTAVMRTGSMAMCHMLRDRGIEPIFQMVCRDRNRLALQSDLLSAAVLGIENVLSLTGDHVVMGDHRDARPVYDLDSVGLLQAMSGLEAGRDMGCDFKGNPNQLDGVPKFFKGCCTTPCSPDPEAQVIKLEKKAAAGAQFVQTQAVYDPATFEKFMRRIEHIKIPVLVGIVVLKSAGMAKYMNRSVPGVQVPDALIKELTAAPKDGLKKVSAAIAARLVREMKPMCQGAHLMTLGWDDLVPDIIAQAGLAS